MSHKEGNQNLFLLKQPSIDSQHDRLNNSISAVFGKRSNYDSKDSAEKLQIKKKKTAFQKYLKKRDFNAQETFLQKQLEDKVMNNQEES